MDTPVEQPQERLTVNKLVEMIKKSQGFTIFVSYLEADPVTEELTIQHRMLRQQYPTEDLEKSFEAFGKMIAEDFQNSGTLLLRQAEKIVNAKVPLQEPPPSS